MSVQIVHEFTCKHHPRYSGKRKPAAVCTAPYNFVAELPFDATRKRMTMIYEQRAEADEGADQVAFVKGAPETVIPLCTRIQNDGRVIPLDSAARAEILQANAQMAAQARRLLAVAY